MKSRLPYGRERVAIGAVGGVDVGDHLGTCPGNVLPAGVDGLQKGQIALRVDGGDWANAMIGGGLHRQAKDGAGVEIELGKILAHQRYLLRLFPTIS